MKFLSPATPGLSFIEYLASNTNPILHHVHCIGQKFPPSSAKA